MTSSAEAGKPDGLGPPVAHEFDDMYAGPGSPPWDIGRPQPAFASLAQAGRLVGRVLDAGCGTGEHTLMAARGGHESIGVDVSTYAIARAKQKAVGTDLPVRFIVGDARALPNLAGLGSPFDTVLDSGLFHVFGDVDRAAYVDAVHKVLRPGGRLFLMCFSDREPGDWGPRRVSEQELRTSFATGWLVDAIAAVAFDIVPTQPSMPSHTHAWLADITRL